MSKTDNPQPILIGVSPRERFSVAAAAMAQLLAATPEPFRLVVVDCATPRPYWDEIEAVLSGRPNVQVIRRDEYLLPNQSRNILSNESRNDEWVCLLENDVFVQEGWLSALLAACAEEDADAAVPLILEGDTHGKVHFDRRLGRIEPCRDSSDGKWTIVPSDFDFSENHQSTRRMQQMIEDHCVLYRPGVIGRLPARDEELNTREPIELAMSLHSVGAKIVFEPSAHVVFKPPTALEPDERSFFANRWNRERAEASIQRVTSRWNLAYLPSSLRFVNRRLRLLDAESHPSAYSLAESSPPR